MVIVLIEKLLIGQIMDTAHTKAGICVYQGDILVMGMESFSHQNNLSECKIENSNLHSFFYIDTGC